MEKDKKNSKSFWEKFLHSLPERKQNEWKKINKNNKIRISKSLDD